MLLVMPGFLIMRQKAEEPEMKILFIICVVLGSGCYWKINNNSTHFMI
jgi:hypothetical protein